jgi:hypothetical protein
VRRLSLHVKHARHLWILLIVGIAFVQYGCSGIERRFKLASLYRNHEWFELRDDVTPGTPAVYLATLAYAFHNFVEAEHVARQLVENGSGDAADARKLLCEIYARQGRYAKALAEWQAARDAGVNLAGIEYIQAAGRHPDLEVIERRPSALRATLEEGRFLVPVTVNGISAAFDIDTGATESGISEAEARRLGLTIETAPGFVIHDATGGVVPMGVAHVDELAIGSFRLRHVVFYVAPDSRIPKALKLRGSIGIPVLLAMQTLRWRRDRTVEIGFPANTFSPAAANLCLDEVQILVSAQFGTARVRGTLDSGANQTKFFPRFRKDFPGNIRLRGGKPSYSISGIGGNKEMPVAVISDLALRIGGMDVSFANAPLLSSDNGDARDHLVVGFDVLNAASQATLDFQAMTLQLQ